MFSLYIHFDSSCTVLDHLGREWFTSYSSNPTPLLYILCRSFDILFFVSWLHTITLWGVSRLLKVINYFIYLLNNCIMLVIICGWEIFRVILVRSRLIVHTTKSSSSPIDQVTYSLLRHSAVSINTGLSPIENMASTYNMKVIALS